MNLYLKNKALKISFGTTLSKLLGLLRQISIAATFGVGFAYDAFNYAYIIPGFLLIIVGGINGPIHNAIVNILTPINSPKASIIIARLTLKLTLLLAAISIIIFLNANFFIEIIAPNLNSETQFSAVNQLKILCISIPLSGFIGLSFGALNTKNKFFISSISPSIISLTIIIFIFIRWIITDKSSLDLNIFSEELIALATVMGTFLQFSVQARELYKIGLLRFKLDWRIGNEEEKRIIKLIFPASISSGLGQINVFVDMFFASSIKGAASGLAYANFLIQAPLGILSSALILPLLPKLSRLINKNSKEDLKKTLTIAIEFCLLSTFFLSGLFITFNQLIIELIFQRGAFNLEAAQLVKNILIAYAIGIPFYLLRDLLIRTYYAFERINLPFKLSILGILLNITFDWILIGAPTNNYETLFNFNFGIFGIVLSSALVNFVSCIILYFKLNDKNINLPNFIIFKKFFLIAISCILSCLSCSLIFQNLYQINSNFIIKLFIGLIGFLSYTLIYYLITKYFKVNNLNLNLKSFR